MSFFRRGKIFMFKIRNLNSREKLSDLSVSFVWFWLKLIVVMFVDPSQRNIKLVVVLHLVNLVPFLIQL